MKLALGLGAMGVSLLAVGCAAGPKPAGETKLGGSTGSSEARHYLDVLDGRAEAAVVEDALAEWIAYDAALLTKLPPAYVLRALREREAGSGSGSAIDAAFAAVLAEDTAATRRALLRAVELDFVHRADTSSLDLLGDDLSGRMREFDWARFDYPGGTEGPNEERAMLLADALDAVTPERRANRAAVAVIRRAEATDALWAYMLGQWRDVPGEDAKKLNRHAVPAYVAMREAAAKDGVELVILSGHRDPKRAAANAARVGNSFAVASFSAHSLGLAIDLVLPKPDGETASDEAESDLGDPGDTTNRFRLTTRPMAAVVDMRRSPVHKWMHLYGHRFGWYPFQHEPWHWEYNPPGFRTVFFADRPGGVPARVPEE